MSSQSLQPDLERTYFPRLDGLRGFAILGVLAEHLVRVEWVSGWAPGMLGVKTFFVLSGFLITSILVAQRDSRAPRIRVAAAFFYRRALRLWPAYYLAIAIAAMLGIAEMRESWLYHSLYLTNFLIALEGQWGGAGHFWTLSVEEQFYLFWFPVVVLAPRKWLVSIIIFALILAPVFRLPIARGLSEFYAVLLPGQIDSFATGALLALAWTRGNLAGLDRLFANSVVRIVLLACVFMLSIPVPESWQSPMLSWVLLPVLVNGAAACIVRACVAGGDDFTRVLQHPSIMHIGRISYGLYICHYFAPLVLTSDRLGLGSLDPKVQTFALASVWIGASLLAAELSWLLIEKPALRLKERSLGLAPR